VKHYLGIDVSLEACSLCIVGGEGRIVRESLSAAPTSRRGIGRSPMVASEPEAILAWLKAARPGPLPRGSVSRQGRCRPLGRRPAPAAARTDRARCARWLHAGLTDARPEVTLLETRHVKAALSAPRGRWRPRPCRAG
jgi:hypothetical protein